MSTRATYGFPDDGVTIYKHHDGYPKGAATHFYNAWRNAGRGMAAGFLRGNDDAELTKSHEYHGDTEYRYEVRKAEGCSSGYRIQPYRRENWDGKPSDWLPMAPQDLVAFIQEGVQPDWVEDYSPLVLVEQQYGKPRWMTAKDAEERRGSQLRLLGLWTLDGPLSEQHANANNVRAEIKALDAALSKAH